MDIRKLRKSERSKIKIMHEAKILYEKYGMENVTFGQIAEAADVCRSTVFNHFPSSNELMTAIYEQEITEINEMCKDAGLAGEELIRAFFEKLIEDTTYYPKLMVQLIVTAITNGEKSKSLSEIEKMIAENLPNKDSLSKTEIDERAMMIIGAYYGMVSHYLMNGLKFDLKKLNKQFSSILDKLLNI